MTIKMVTRVINFAQGSVASLVIELLARDQVVFDGVDADFFEGNALAGGFGVTSR